MPSGKRASCCIKNAHGTDGGNVRPPPATIPVAKPRHGNLSNPPDAPSRRPFAAGARENAGFGLRVAAEGSRESGSRRGPNPARSERAPGRCALRPGIEKGVVPSLHRGRRVAAETTLLELPSASPGSRSPPSLWRGRGRWPGFYLTFRAHRGRSKLLGYDSVQPIDREWRFGSCRSRGRFDEARGAASVRARRCGGPRRPGGCGRPGNGAPHGHGRPARGWDGNLAAGGCGRDTSVPGKSVRQRCLAASRPAWNGPGRGPRAPRAPSRLRYPTERGPVSTLPEGGWRAEPPEGRAGGVARSGARPPGPARRGRHPDPDRGRSMGVR